MCVCVGGGVTSRDGYLIGGIPDSTQHVFRLLPIAAEQNILCACLDLNFRLRAHGMENNCGIHERVFGCEYLRRVCG